MPGLDDQDQSEVFDEDNTDASQTGGITNEYRTFEELPEVLDVTAEAGDSDDGSADDADEDLDTSLDDRGSRRGTGDPSGLDDPADVEADPGDREATGEVELVYTGLLEDVPDAAARTAVWEAERLSDDDIEDLGYGPEGETQ